MISSHIDKFDSYLVKSDFKFVFHKDFKPHIKTDFYHNATIIDLEGYLLYWIDYFIQRGHIFYHINELNTTSINAKRNTTYNHYIKQPMQAIELKLNIFFARNPNLINSLNDILTILYLENTLTFHQEKNMISNKSFQVILSK